MKILKKVFVTLIASSLLLSCLVLSAFAEEPNLEGEIEDILEYYTFKSYLEEDFELHSADSSYSYIPCVCPNCGTLLSARKGGLGGRQSYYYCVNADAGNCTFAQVVQSALSPMITFTEHGPNAHAGVTATTVDDNGNKVLQILNRSKNREIGYMVTPKVYNESTGKYTQHYTDSTIISFRVKTANDAFYSSEINTNTPVPPKDPITGDFIEPQSLNNGSNFYVKTSSTYSFVPKGKEEAHTTSMLWKLFAMNCNYMDADSGQKAVFTYLEYDPDWTRESEIYVQKTLNLTPLLNTWYTVNIVMDYDADKYTLTVAPDGGEPVTVDNIAIDGFESTAYVDLKINDGTQSGTITWLDDIAVYDGTFIRHGVDVEKKTAESIIALDALLNASTTSIADKVRIADVFNTLFNTDVDGLGGVYYSTKDTTPNKDEVDAIIENAKTSSINKAYQEAFIAYTDAIAVDSGYYNRVEYLKGVVRFDELFSDDIFESPDNDAIKAQFPGVTDVDALRLAKSKYDKEVTSINRVRVHSEAFLELIKDYDPANKSYVYMTDYLDALKLFAERDSAYKYEIIVPGAGEGGADLIRYATVADAEVDLLAIVKKTEEIKSTADTFIAAVNQIVSADSFVVAYENYLTASAIYNDGVIHEALDNKTYRGLEEAIADYLYENIAINEKVAQSIAFIDLVERAKSFTYYVTILAELDKAAAYIDGNKAELYAEPDYPGVAEATAKYHELRAFLANCVTSANTYIAAVNAIADASGFAAKKAAVEAALLLKADGDIIGIEGVFEANNTLSVAESEIKVLESNSAALINAVNALKEANTLAQRRELIFIANSVKDNTEASINGVAAAKTELETYIAKYNSDVEVLNNAFSGVLANTNAAVSAIAPTANAYRAAEIIKAVIPAAAAEK